MTLIYQILIKLLLSLTGSAISVVSQILVALERNAFILCGLFTRPISPSVWSSSIYEFS